MVFRHLLQQILKRFLCALEIAFVEHRLDRRHQRFASFGGVAGRYHGAADQGSHFSVARFSLEDLSGYLHGPVVLTQAHEGAREKSLQLGRVRRPFDPEIQELKDDRRSSGIKERRTRRNQELALGRILLDHMAIEAFRLVQLPRIQQHGAEA